MMEQLKDRRTPYICAPLTGGNKAELFAELEKILPEQPDLIEWRADFFRKIDNTEAVLKIAEELAAASGIPLLFTIRSEKEGGEKIRISEAEKVALLTAVCASPAVDMIDFEVSNHPEYIRAIQETAQEHSTKLILSYHHFGHTPENAELMRYFYQAEFYGADIAKVAVMPKDKSDVFRLLDVTREADKALAIPVVTMSMAQIGSLSRMIGWAYGSIITFGVGAQSSAPGQLPIGKLRKMIEMMQETSEA